MRNACVPLTKGNMKHNFPQLSPTQFPNVFYTLIVVPHVFNKYDIKISIYPGTPG